MRGLWLEGGRVRFRDDLPEPVASPGEAVVAIRRGGICGTDLEMLRGYSGFTGVPGHEFAGVVERALGAPEWEGRRVVGEINVSCGRCPACRGGRRTHCASRTVLGIRGRDGAFAERLAIPIMNLHALPAEIDDEAAVFVEPLAAALRVQEQVAIRPESNVVVIGAGRLGQLVARALARTGCRLAVVARHAGSRALLEAVGIRTVPLEGITSVWADIAVECTGDPAGLDLARRAVKPLGTIVLKSTHAGAAGANLSGVVVDELTVVGSRCGPFPAALQMLAAHEVDVVPLVQGRYPLEQGEEALRQAAERGVLKVVLEV